MTCFPSEPLDQLRYGAVGKSVHHANHTYTLIVSPETITTTRWGIVDRLVFQTDDELGRVAFFEAVYEYGATEMQDYDYLTENEEFDCDEVVPQEVTVTKYIKVPQ